ncbi:MAG: hypothetical protein V1777_05695 [Candidatus Micrarchaeota archaeon]
MNSRGIIFTVSVLVLILAIIVLTTSIQRSDFSIANQPELSALKIAGQKYRDISRSLLELDLNGPKKNTLSLGLPFSYGSDQNRFFISQRFPVNPGEISDYFNSLNGYRIFFGKQALKGLPHGFLLDINTAKDANWGGTANQLNFLLNRQCMAYRFSVNRIVFEDANNSQCIGTYNPTNTRKTQIKIKFSDSREDLNAALCNGVACPANAFNDANSESYFSIRFDSNASPKSGLPVIGTHYSVAADYNVFLYCDNPDCFSKPIQFLFGKSIQVSRDSNQTANFDWNFEFKQNLSRFLTLDVNFAIQNPDYNIIRTNNPGQISQN